MSAPKTNRKPSAPYSTDRVRAEAAKEYRKGTPLPLAIRKIDVAAKRPTIGLVSPVYWKLTGEADPIRSKGTRALASAVRRRRESGVRWEVLAASLSAGLGRKVSTADAKSLAARGGLDLAASYVGRGTRASAPKTLETPAASAAKVAAK